MTTLRRSAAIAAALAALTLAGCASSDKRAASTDQPTATTQAPATTADETFPDEGLDTPTTNLPTATLRVGQAETLVETDSGREVLRVVVDKAVAIAGEPYNKPERGYFLGIHVKVKALADEQTSLWGDFYVLQRGHHYDPDAYAERFAPTLDYVDLHAGETAEGWLVFDVPARHGEVILGQSDGSGGKVATWKF